MSNTTSMNSNFMHTPQRLPLHVQATVLISLQLRAGELRARVPWRSKVSQQCCERECERKEADGASNVQ